MNNKVMIIGPSLEHNNIGGVYNHIKVLSDLESLQNAHFYDVGSVHSNVRQPFHKIIINIVRIRKIVKRNHINTVLINSSINLSSLIKLCLTLLILPADIKTHIYFHGGRFENIFDGKNYILKLVINTMLRYNANYHFLSRVQRNGFEKYFNGRNTGNYSNYSAYDSIIPRSNDDTKKLKIMYCGRIVKTKGVYELFEAFKYLYINETKNITLKYVGSGPDLENLKNIANEFNHECIEFTGYLSGEKLDFEYASADILVFPSYSEGFPYIMIESFRAGLPMICTPVGALADFVQDGVTGFQIEKRSVEAIVEAVIKCLNNKKLLKDMSDNCHHVFTSKLTRAKAEEYYSKIIQNN